MPMWKLLALAWEMPLKAVSVGCSRDRKTIFWE